jgi:NAD(P)-dependent dehydrogenase (short-subunit alcohol dehydrogenase family)
MVRQLSALDAARTDQNSRQEYDVGIFIAGGTSGIGLAIAERLAVSRPTVPMFLAYASNTAAAEQALKKLGSQPHIHSIKVDIADPDALRAAMQMVKATAPQIDVLVHSTVDRSSTKLLEASPEEFRRSIDVNGTSLLYVVQSANDLLRKGSSILYLSGRAAEAVGPGAGTGGAAGKAMGECLVRYLAVALGPRHIRINTLRSGPVDTPYLRQIVGVSEGAEFTAPPTLNGLPAMADDVASVAEFLLSDSARMMTGQIVMVDGGRSILAASPKPAAKE